MSSGAAIARARPLVTTWWIVPLGIALASRAFSVSWLLAGLAITPDAPFRGEGLTLLDGRWYLSIATTGYHAHGVPGPNGTFHDFAFFPAWPALFGSISRLSGIEPGLVAIVLANVLACLAMVCAWRALAPRFGPDAATRGLALFAFSPAAHVLSLAYSEALFLLLAALAFLTPVASGGRAALAALAQTVRPPGFAIGATALATLRSAPRRSLLVLAAAPIVFGLWWLLIGWLTGDPLGYLRGTPSWWTVMGSPSGPFSWRPVLDRALERGVLSDLASPVAVTVLVAVLLVASLALWKDPRRRDLGWYCLAVIAPTLLLAHWEQWPRHSLLAVPAFVWLAARLGDRARSVTIASFAMLQVLFILQVTHRSMTP